MPNAAVPLLAAVLAVSPAAPVRPVPPVVPAQAVTTAPAETTRFTAGVVEILSPWSRATQPGQKVAAAYMVLHNTGESPVALVSASTPVARSVVFHDTGVKDGFMQMLPHEGGFAIPPGGEIELAPGGPHLMMVGVARSLRVGKVYPLTLTFSDGATTTVDMVVWDVGMIRTRKP